MSDLPTSDRAASAPSNSGVDQVDVRGPRFGAGLTTVVLVAVLIVAAFSTTVAAVLVGLQAIVFAVGAYVGPRRSLYGVAYATLVAPLLSPAVEREPASGPRFAQVVGFVFAAVGFLGYLTGATVVGTLFTAFALFASFLNAVFGICLACMLYPSVARLIHRPA